MITLCGSTYAKFVCSIILKQPSITICCSSSIELNLQAHSILESNSLLILFFFFTILIISHQPFFFNKKRQKKSTFYSRLNFFVWCDDFTLWSGSRTSYELCSLSINIIYEFLCFFNGGMGIFNFLLYNIDKFYLGNN